MTARRRARRPILLPHGGARWTMTGVGLLSLSTSWSGAAPRYQHVVEAAIALVLLFAGVLPAHVRPHTREAVYGLVTFFIGMAGVVSGRSLDESLSLMTGAAILAGLSLAFGPPPRGAKHATP